jgi:hypothetical protein
MGLALKITVVNSISKIQWDKFQYVVFDSPNIKQEYLFRHATIRDTFQKRKSTYDHACLRMANYVSCTSKGQADNMLAILLSIGAKGMITRQPFSLYTVGYSAEIFKFKVGSNNETCPILSQHIF